MKATLIYRNKRVLSDGSIEEIVIWRLPEAPPESTKDRLHGLIYRLYLGLADGTCKVRYDNEQGKGDHKHLLEQEMPYVFLSIEKLLDDFVADVKRAREGT